MPDPQAPLDVLDAVRSRYAEGARVQVPALCCPVDYDARLLAVLPEEIVERDYGCGDPSRFVRPGETVLDLGSGAGKICYMASQITGPEGRVIGVDATPDMLALARRHAGEIGDRIGWHNVDFRRGRIQDLALDLDALERWIAANPVTDLAGAEALRAEKRRLRAAEPMIPDGSVDLVLSNCVLNLVDDGHKEKLFREIHRVLKPGGRCAISDIVSDEDVPARMQADPDLWTGCIAGALRADRFVQAFADAGLYGVEVVAYQEAPWAVVEGLEFRSLTVVAHKGKEGPCMEHNEAVIYHGPFSQVVDDDGHTFRRGERTAICRKTFRILTSGPYAASFTPVEPLVAIRPEDALPFACTGSRVRAPRETKAGAVRADAGPGAACCPPAAETDGGGACC